MPSNNPLRFDGRLSCAGCRWVVGGATGDGAEAASALRILSACVSGRAGAGAGALSLLYNCASASRILLDELRSLRCVDGAFAVANCRVAHKTQMSRVDETCLVSGTLSICRGRCNILEVPVRGAWWRLCGSMGTVCGELL